MFDYRIISDIRYINMAIFICCIFVMVFEWFTILLYASWLVKIQTFNSLKTNKYQLIIYALLIFINIIRKFYKNLAHLQTKYRHNIFARCLLINRSTYQTNFWPHGWTLCPLNSEMGLSVLNRVETSPYYHTWNSRNIRIKLFTSTIYGPP